MRLALFEVNPTDESYLAWKERKVMQFRTPATNRRMDVLLSVALAVQLVLLPLTVAILKGDLLLYFVSLVGAGWLLFFLYFVAGPDDIRLDGNSGTYELTAGWPWKPMTRFGSFDAIRGVCLTPRNGVLLLLKKPGWIRKGVVLSRSGTSRALAEEVSREFGFPILSYSKR